MPATAHAYITYDTPEHIHLVPLGDGKVCILETEEAAELLARAVDACGPHRHNGHGVKHDNGQVQAAYKSGIKQILETDFEEESRQREWQKYRHGLWNGRLHSSQSHATRPVPELILMPGLENADKWQMVMPHPQTGMPVVRDIDPTFAKDLNELMPVRGAKGAYKYDVGYRQKPQGYKK